MKNIAIIDADLISRKNHRFPNLAAMKLSAYWQPYAKLKLDYNDLDQFDHVYISKVFTDTPIDKGILELPNVTYGGTGFYFDKAPALPYEIEHIMPDYHLYDEWSAGKKNVEEYTDYSIGFLTRGCFRGCEFCVNQNYRSVQEHSPLKEFYDPTRKKICLLDDNFLGCKNWRPLLEELIATNKRFKFKQGLDERILTEKKCQLLFSAKYDGKITFAFDNIADKEIIIKKLEMIRRYTNERITFYVLCGFDRNNSYDDSFWRQDVLDMFERIKILASYKCIPYIMRFNRYEESPFRGLYVTVAGWCNQPSMFVKKSLKEYVAARADQGRKADIGYLEFALKEIPELQKYYEINMFNDCSLLENF